MGQSIRKANLMSNNLGYMTMLFSSPLSCFSYSHCKDLLLSQQDGNRINVQNLEDIKNSGWIWGEGWRVKKTTDIGIGRGAEEWRKWGEGNLPETQTRYSLNDLKEGKSNVLSHSWSPVILDNGVNQPFLLVTIGRTQLLHACCIISSIQQGKNNCPLFYRCKKKGPWPRNMSWKGQIELLWPKVVQTPCGLCICGEVIFCRDHQGKKNTQVFDLEL